MENLKKIGRGLKKGLWYLFIGISSIIVLYFSFAFLCYLLAIGISMFNIIFKLGAEEVRLYEFEIESMKDNHTFVMSRYNGESELQYYFLRKTGGRIQTGHTDADNSSIIEDGQNKIEVYTEVPKYGQKLFLKVQEWGSIDGEGFLEKQYIYHVPEGSVKYEYEVDLE